MSGPRLHPVEEFRQQSSRATRETLALLMENVDGAIKNEGLTRMRVERIEAWVPRADDVLLRRGLFGRLKWLLRGR